MTHERHPTIGIIGGSGLYDMAELTDREERTVATPFGDPSGPYVIGTLRGKRVAFLARHGAGHRILPSELNFRANIYGFKVLGVERILSASAVGSLKEEYRPLDIVVPDQFFDRTKGRISTFFGRGLVAHVAFAHPFCGDLSAIAADAARDGRRDRPPRRHLREHGRAAVLDAGRVEAVSVVGHGRHRHDEPAGGQARARGGDLLRDARARHRLRLLAPGPRLGDGRPDHREPDAERGDRAADDRRSGRAGSPARAPARARTRSPPRSSRRPEHVPEQTKQELAPIIGKYIGKVDEVRGSRLGGSETSLKLTEHLEIL